MISPAYLDIRNVDIMDNPLKILLLDDVPAEARMIQDVLTTAYPNAAFRIVNDKASYLGALAEFQPSIVIADNSLPNLSAADALSVIRRQPVSIPFIFLANEESEELAISLLKLGADDYVLKDRPKRLPASVERNVKQHAALQEKQLALLEITKSEEKYRTFIERISDAFIALDKDWCYTYLNRQAGELVHHDPAALIGKNVWEVFPDAVGSATYQGFMQAMQEQKYLCNTDYYEPLDLWQENHLYPSKDGLSVFIRDITMRKKAEQRLQESNEELRDLTSRLQDVREEERASMAREIHDELGQQLTGLKMDMAAIAKRIANPTHQTFVEEKIKGTLNLLDTTINTVRKIAAELRPSILDDLGLIAAIEWQAQEFEKRSGIRTQFQTDTESFDFPSRIAIGLFRICQESLTNVARHAQAKLVTISLQLKTANEMQLQITDDGKGFAVNETGGKKTLGLLGIKERAQMMGGSLEIKSEPGKGTSVRVLVPTK